MKVIAASVTLLPWPLESPYVSGPTEFWPLNLETEITTQPRKPSTWTQSVVCSMKQTIDEFLVSAMS